MFTHYKVTSGHQQVTLKLHSTPASHTQCKPTTIAQSKTNKQTNKNKMKTKQFQHGGQYSNFHFTKKVIT